MKFLLCSSGISNPSIHEALVRLLGKPVEECDALCIPTGVQPFPGGPAHVYRFVSGATASPMCGLGWRSLGVLELTALPSIRPEHWIPAVEAADALGLSRWITLKLIVFPQAIAIAMPGLTNTLISLVKDTSLVMLVGMHDLMGTTQLSRADNAWGNVMWEAYLFAGLIYVLICGISGGKERRMAKELKEGDKAPDIDLPATQIGSVFPDKKDTKTLRLSDFKGKKNVVLWFFPKALTGG